MLILVETVSSHHSKRPDNWEKTSSLGNPKSNVNKYRPTRFTSAVFKEEMAIQVSACTYEGNTTGNNGLVPDIPDSPRAQSPFYGLFIGSK